MWSLGSGLVEVKCPYKHRDVTPLEGASLDKDFCLTVNGTLNLPIMLYYSQIMLQFLSTEKGIVMFTVDKQIPTMDHRTVLKRTRT